MLRGSRGKESGRERKREGGGEKDDQNTQVMGMKTHSHFNRNGVPPPPVLLSCALECVNVHVRDLHTGVCCDQTHSMGCVTHQIMFTHIRAAACRCAEECYT